LYASDKTLACQDCNQEFVFSSSEQQFYADRQFSEPRRCPSCRAARKRSAATSVAALRTMVAAPAPAAATPPAPARCSLPRARAAAARPRFRSAPAARSRSTAATASPRAGH